jgi:vancomycin resistance protein YoaR
VSATAPFAIPRKKASFGKKAAIAGILLVVMTGVIVGTDFAWSYNKVHKGVKIEGVDIGGLGKAAATEKLQVALDGRLAGTRVHVRPDAVSEERLATKAVSWEGEGDSPEEGDVADPAQEAGPAGPEEASITWTLSATDLGASVDAAALVDKAYEIGQVSSVFDVVPSLVDRVNSWAGNIDLSATVDFDRDQLAVALKPINDTIGIGMVNSNIDIDSGGFAWVRSGRTGIKVDEALFTERAESMLLDRSGEAFEAPMRTIPININDDAAQVFATEVNDILDEPIVFDYEGEVWEADAALLGAWVTVAVEGEGSAQRLVASVDAAKAYDGLRQLMDEAGFGTAQNASIDVSSGTPVIVGGERGEGPDLLRAVEDVQSILFGSATSRRVFCGTAQVDPAVTAADVSSWGVIELIASFDLGYGSGSGSNREFNIERCLDRLNNSLVAPGEDWLWNEVVGRCDESSGYREAGAINDQNEMVQEPGGGICNVATGVFNAAYEAGLPILERANHSLYLPHYPLGRDAAVSWEYPTLSFTNDTDRHILVTARYDGSSMTVSIWGTSPQRTVESRNSDWVEAATGGKSITNYRTVTGLDGTVLHEDVFYSYFPPKKEEPKPEDT